MLRGSRGGGGSANFGGMLHNFTGAHPANVNVFFWISQPKASRLAHLLGDLIKGGSGCVVIEMHGMPPRRPRECVQANYQQLIPNLQFTYCNMHKLH